MERIEEFYREIVSSQNALYEGRWQTSVEAGTERGLLQKVYGTQLNQNNVLTSITEGKSRVFLKRFSDESIGIQNYLGLSEDGEDYKEDGPPPLIEPSHIDEDKKDKDAMNVLTLEVILFDGEHRNHELNLQLMINPRLNQNITYSESLESTAVSEDDPVQVTVVADDGTPIIKSRHRIIRSLRVENITVDVFQKENLYMKERDLIKLNLTLNDCTDMQAGGRSIDDCIVLTFEKKDGKEHNFLKFPEQMTILLNPKPLDVYMEKIANYAFAATMCIMISFFVMLGQIKQVAENHALAQSLSLTTIGVNLVWNFFFFAIHFQFCLWGEFM